MVQDGSPLYHLETSPIPSLSQSFSDYAYSASAIDSIGQSTESQHQIYYCGCGKMVDLNISAWCDDCVPARYCSRRCGRMIAAGSPSFLCVQCSSIKQCVGMCGTDIPAYSLSDWCTSCLVLRKCKSEGCMSMLPNGQRRDFCILCTTLCPNECGNYVLTDNGSPLCDQCMQDAESMAAEVLSMSNV